MCLLNPSPPNPTRPHEPHTDQISTILLFQTWGRVGGCNRSPLFPLHQPCHLDNAFPLVLTSPLGIATPPTLTCTLLKKEFATWFKMITSTFFDEWPGYQIPNRPLSLRHGSPLPMATPAGWQKRQTPKPNQKKVEGRGLSVHPN